MTERGRAIARELSQGRAFHPFPGRPDRDRADWLVTTWLRILA
jgi:hypothetical protein